MFLEGLEEFGVTGEGVEAENVIVGAHGKRKENGACKMYPA